jgi:hypothetical protein
MYDEPDNVISAELGPQEKLLWAGRPPLGVVFRSFDIFYIPFSIFWVGFVSLFVALTIAEGEIIGVLFCIPFVLVGLYLIFFRFLVDAKQRGKPTTGCPMNESSSSPAFLTEKQSPST